MNYKEQLENVNQELELILSTDNQEAKELENKLQELKAEQEEIQQSIQDAKEKFNTKLYAKKSEELRGNEDIQQLILTKIEEAKREPLITKEKYQELENSLNAIHQQSFNSAETELKEILKRLEEIQAELLESDKLTSELMHKLQREVYKDPLPANMTHLGHSGSLTIDGVSYNADLKPTTNVQALRVINRLNPTQLLKTLKFK